jgi:DNA-binding transcriptional LysR family regulator
MDLGRLRALHAVATYGSVLAASEALHCTPSAVSQQLAKLDRETGTRLLERDGRGLRLTDAGKLLAGHAARVLDAVDEARSALAAYHLEVVGEVTVGAFATACRGLLPPALATLTTRHPQLAARVVEMNPYEAIDALGRGRVEVAVVDDWPEVGLHLPEGTSFLELGFDVADLIVPAGHRLTAAKNVTLEGARPQRWIASPPGTICHDWLMRVLPGVLPDYYVGEFETQLTLIAAGLGVALVPRLARSGLPQGVAAVAVTPTPTRRVMVVWRSSSSARPAVVAATEALQEAWAMRQTGC